MRHTMAPALIACLALAACSDSTGPSATIEDTNFAPALGVDLSAMTKTSSGLYYRDLVVGAGGLVTVGQQVGAHYTGWLPNGTQFDHNGQGDVPYSFQVGVGRVIKGWDEGVPGMRVGGVRQLVIPPSLGYGSQGIGPIPPNAILVFRVEVVSAQ